MKNKILLFFKKIFFHEIEKYENCILCGKKLEGSRRKFCSNKCLNEFWRKQYAKPYTPIMTDKLIRVREKYKKNTGGVKDRAKASRIAMKKYPSLNGITCQICNKKKAVHRHHEDYTKPEEVIFVCWECHGKLHADINDKKQLTTFPIELERRINN